MLEFYEIFRVISKGPLQSNDRTARLRQDTEGDTRDQAEGNVRNDTGERRTGQEENMFNLDKGKDGLMSRSGLLK